MWMVLGLGYMLMITELLSEVEYVKLMREASIVFGKRFKAEVQKVPVIQKVPIGRTRMWRSLYVRAPKEKAARGHKKLCVSVSV